MCVNVISSRPVVDLARNMKIYLLVTGGRYVLTGRDCSKQTEHHDFKTSERQYTML